MPTRRQFVARSGALAAGALLVGRTIRAGVPAPSPHLAAPDAGARRVAREPAAVRAVLAAALEAARRAGATYADARVGRTRERFVFARDRRLDDVLDTDSLGLGVRALAEGAIGYAAVRTLTVDAAAGAAREAVATARATARHAGQRVAWADAPVVRDGTWRSAYAVDPWDVPIERMAALLLDTHSAALAVPGLRGARGILYFVKEERTYANSEGTTTAQTLVRSWPYLELSAVSADRTDAYTRNVGDLAAGRGWEYVEELALPQRARHLAEETVATLSAPRVEPGRWDIVLDPRNLSLTIHETVAHATELDRALGWEANSAGTTFVAPPKRVLGTLRFGSDLMHVRADRSQPGGLATVGWDEDGAAPADFDVIRKGVFVDYQTTRELAPTLAWWDAQQGRATRSRGCAHAESWSQVPFQRMPNVSLQPGARDLTQDDLVAATDRGLLFEGNGAYSVDQQRYNAQFGAGAVWEIRGGKRVGLRRGAVYQLRTPEFWASLDLLGGSRAYRLHGIYFDGKGEPGQRNAVSHGTPPARFRQVAILDAGGT